MAFDLLTEVQKAQYDHFAGDPDKIQFASLI